MTQRLANEQRRLDELSLADLAVRTSLGTSYGTLAPATGRPAQAIAQLTRAVQLSRQLRSSLEQALSLMALGDACHAAGAADDAHCAWAEAREVFRRLRNDPAAATATSLLGRAAPG